VAALQGRTNFAMSSRENRAAAAAETASLPSIFHSTASRSGSTGLREHPRSREQVLAGIEWGARSPTNQQMRPPGEVSIVYMD